MILSDHLFTVESPAVTALLPSSYSAGGPQITWVCNQHFPLGLPVSVGLRAIFGLDGFFLGSKKSRYVE